MNDLLTEDQTFDKIDYTHSAIEKGSYEYCVFRHCNFSNCDLSYIKFLECEFEDCNFSNTTFRATALQDSQMNGCKIMGVHFEECNAFGFSVHFSKCQLDHSSFYKMDLTRSRFTHCRMHGTDLSGANLSSLVLAGCDLLNAKIEHCDLSHADFRKAVNYTLDPDMNTMKKARFSLPEVTGLLAKYNIEIDSND